MPDCHKAGIKSKLVELVTCRKCGYLFGALQDLGPRKAQDPNSDESDKAEFDSFSTELGWIADSFWSYFSVDDDLPYPDQFMLDESDEDENDLIMKPAELEWCTICGRRKDEGRGDNCKCERPHVRTIRIFHRQCPHSKNAKDRENLYKQEKQLLGSCPNCGARNSSGIEPVQRFQESDDELGLAMAIPFAHFQCSTLQKYDIIHRKLLCFTDNRQKAAAFPSHLEEETFAHDMGRKIVTIVKEGKISLMNLGDKLWDMTDRDSKSYDPDFFLPVSRYPDERVDKKTNRNLWVAETLSYFGIPDSARESAEDFGLVSVEYDVETKDKLAFQKLFKSLELGEANSILQVLLAYVRQRKAFTLPDGVTAENQAFGHVKVDISYVLKREGDKNTNGWLPHGNRDNMITSYLQRLLKLSRPDVFELSEKIWNFLINHSLLFENKRRNGWKLGHELLYVNTPSSRFVCNRCGYITTYNVKNCCPRKDCRGSLQKHDFDLKKESIIAKWVAGVPEISFKTLKSEEHTAQINKDLAKTIEDSFRGEGVNLLSSTTTFEMGINIGDLQKVLLRNPPPTSSSYVQRVGRAGRGKDKNSICVTLCRRTKYDADSWNNPLRLMMGDVKTPTVFTKNKIIAQRHFNAVLFAKFLKLKIYTEKLLTEFKQQIRLEPFLNLESRSRIPQDWIKEQATYLDFCSWLEYQKEIGVFQTNIGESLISTLSSFELAKTRAKEVYNTLISSTGDELMELMEQYRNLQDIGNDKDASELSQAIKNLLGSDIVNVLAKRGFLPRYAFPLDVVTLETGSTRWSRDTDVELSRDRSIAIAEFAPGSQVIAHKKVFTSSGLYVVGKNDVPQRKWYSKCHTCDQIRIANTQEELLGKCPICLTSITKLVTNPFVEPIAFSIRLDPGSERHRRSSLVRLRQTLTHFIDNIDDQSFHNMGLFNVAIAESGKLFKYNLGPKGMGFVICSKCGFSSSVSTYKAGKPHKRLRGFGRKECTHIPWGYNKGLAYGHEFHTFCLIARPERVPDSIESLAYSLQRGICIVLDLDISDIGVSWRFLANKANCEIILYDNTPGGAGFVREGFNRWNEVVTTAQQVCTNCNCETACYDCLKSYYNQSFHEKLNRHSVIEFF